MHDEKILKDLPEPIRHYIEHLERMRQDFVANLSHELRTPLTVIQGYLETLVKQESENTPQRQKIFNQMHQHSQRMLHIIQDLLLLSSLDREDTPTLEQENINIKHMLDSLLLEAISISGEKRHHISLSARDGLLLNGAENELKSLFSNIIINAIKYTPAQGHIRIEWFLNEKQQAVFQVTDTGIGIGKEHIPRITERFYRVDKARSSTSGGTGLGLAIVNHVVLRHQAELHIDSQLNKGSCFSCIFPSKRTSF
jgi:two-component system phosphate regulon sensor histidine kinase PhoR